MDSWTQNADMQKERRMLGAAVIDDMIYAIGGGTTSHGENPTNTVEKYDPNTDTWTYVASMNIARSRIGAAVLNGKIYVFGGYDGSQSLKTIEVYDPEADTWTICDDELPEVCEGTTALTVEDKIYVFCSQGTFNSPHLWLYDPLAISDNRWSQKATPDPLILDHGAEEPNAALVGKYLTYIPYNSFDDPVLQLYDTTTFEWKISIGPIDDHSDGASIGVGGYLYAIGGYTYDTHAERFYLP